VRGMSAEGLRCLLSEAGVEKRVAHTVMRTVDAYLARADTGPVVLYLEKSKESAQGRGTVRVRVLDLPLW